MNFDFFDAQLPVVNSVEQKQFELKQLQEVADKIGHFMWSYKTDFADKTGVDTKDHVGPIAQELLGIPGLESAVIQTEDGTLAIDTNYLSLATFSLLAALARLIGVKGDDTTEQSMADSVSDSGTVPTTSETEETSGADGTATIGTEELQSKVVQPSLEETQTVHNTESDTSKASKLGE